MIEFAADYETMQELVDDGADDDDHDGAEGDDEDDDEDDDDDDEKNRIARDQFEEELGKMFDTLYESLICQSKKRQKINFQRVSWKNYCSLSRFMNVLAAAKFRSGVSYRSQSYALTCWKGCIER